MAVSSLAAIRESSRCPNSLNQLIFPAHGHRSPCKSFKREDFPAPLGPRSAVCSPASRVQFISFKTNFLSCKPGIKTEALSILKRRSCIARKANTQFAPAYKALACESHAFLHKPQVAQKHSPHHQYCGHQKQR